MWRHIHAGCLFFGVKVIKIKLSSLSSPRKKLSSSSGGGGGGGKKQERTILCIACTFFYRLGCLSSKKKKGGGGGGPWLVGWLVFVRASVCMWDEQWISTKQFENIMMMMMMIMEESERKKENNSENNAIFKRHSKFRRAPPSLSFKRVKSGMVM